jgi:hypothetical protein
MSRNITNTPSKTNVYVNTIDVFEGTLPVVVTQTSANQPVNISLKGLTALGPANHVIKMNSTGTELIYSEDSGSNWTLDGSNLYPLSTSTNILIGTQSNANGYGILSSGKEIAIEESTSSTNDPTLRLINGTNNATIKLDDSGDMFFSDATNKYSFTKKLELNFIGAELTDGTNDFTLPSSTGTLALSSEIPQDTNDLTNGAGFITASSTDTLTNKSMSYSQLTGTPTIPTNNNQLTNGAGYITASSSDTLTNKTIASFTNSNSNTITVPSSAGTLALSSEIPTDNLFLSNGAGYITASSTDTLTNKSISYSQLTGTPSNSTANGFTGLTSYTKGDILFYNTGTIFSKLAIGTQGQVLKCSSTGVVEWANDTSTGFTATAPIVITNNDISYDISSLTNATLALSDNVFVQQGTNLRKTTFTDIKTLINTDTTYTATSPLKLTGTAFSIDQNLFNITTTMNDNDEIILFDTSDNFDKILFSNFKTSLGIPNLTTATSFATSATGVIKLGNSQGTAQTASLEFYGTSFKLKNTSNVNVATFTPVSNTCNLDLNGGLLTKFTASTNATWNGNTIGTIYGGTGLTSYIKGQVLYASGTNTLAKLNIGSFKQFLMVGSTGIPTWSNLPSSIWTTITEPQTTDYFLLVDSDLSTYEKVTVDNFIQLYQDSINYGADLPIVKNTTTDKYTFSISGLSLSAGSEVNDLSIFIQGVSGANTFKKLTGLQLQSYTTNSGINFSTNTTNTNTRVFGNSLRNSNINGSILSLQSAGTTRISINNDIITMPRTPTDLRVAHSTDTNNFSSVSTNCKISSTNDLHLLFTPSQSFSNSRNRFVCIAGGSQSETAIFGYVGSNFSIGSGGIPDGNTTTPIGSSFAMSTGTAGVFTICNRSSTSFSDTVTQLQIKLNDTDFYTENVTINGNVGEAVLKLNSSGGALVGSNGRSYIGRDTSTGYIYLGNATDSSELFSNTTYAKGIEFSGILKGTKTDTTYGSSQANVSWPPVAQQLFQTSTASNRQNGYLINTLYRVPYTGNERYWSCFQIFLTSSSTSILGWGFHSPTSFVQRFYIKGNGDVFAAGSYTGSDKRIKKDIIDADTTECVNIMKSIKLKKYKYNDDYRQQFEKTDGYVYGFIADDIGNSPPELSYCMNNISAPITIDDVNITDLKTIEKSRILSILWGVCDFQQNKIEKLENEVETLKTEIANIKTHLNL